MATVRQHLYGERPRFAVATVAAVGVATAAILAPIGVFELGTSGPVGTGAFALAFGVVPGLAGAICGWYRLGAPAAVASGAAPAVAFYLLVLVGAALEVGSFGGGDSPLAPFALALASPGLVGSIGGFSVSVAAALLTDRAP